MSIAETPSTPYPFGASHKDFRLAAETIPTRDLQAEVENARWNVLRTEDDLGASNEVARIQLAELIDELATRRRLLDRFYDHPMAPTWPAKDLALEDRVRVVKDALPMEQFCRQLMGVDLQNSGGHLIGRCPLPGHDDRSPSFHVYVDHAWCYGCNRGGDQIALAKYVLGTDRFYEALERLEVEAGIGNRGGA